MVVGWLQLIDYNTVVEIVEINMLTPANKVKSCIKSSGVRFRIKKLCQIFIKNKIYEVEFMFVAYIGTQKKLNQFCENF